MNADLLDTLIQSHLPAAAAGDSEAYARIVAGCQGMVASIALAIVRDVPASEDIAQDAFLSAWQNLRKLGKPGSFLPWLRQITRNLARDHLRAQHYRANPDGDIDALIASVADPSPGPAEALSETQDAEVAAAVIDALPVESREVLLLYYREGQRSRQVASLLGMSDAAVRKRLSRARLAIREELLQRIGDFAQRSAPGSAFTAAVLSTLTLASPSTATAVALTTGGSLFGKGLAKVLLGFSGTLTLGIAGALTGVWWKLREYLRDPFDEREARDIRRYGYVLSSMVIAFTVSMMFVAGMHGWFWQTLLCVAYIVGVNLMCRLWLKRILARRRAYELATDPVGTAARQQREKFRSRLGLAIGSTLGIGILLWALHSTGRI